MPEIKIQHVVSCSSEDRNNPADNLLRPEGTHKWKSMTAGEKSISVVLQLEKSSQINTIDIGNEGSAFVEILVGRSSATSDKDYQVLLVASTFMTPLEARNGTNRTSVRMFNSSQLSSTALSEKWDRIKIVCTQPFNKTSTYGLSFIKFHSTSNQTSSDKQAAQKDQKTLGFFKIKTDDGEDTVKAGSLFTNRAKHETASPATPLSGAAAVRAAARKVEAPKSQVASTSSSSSSTLASTPHRKAEPVTVVKQEKKQDAPSPAQKKQSRKHVASDDDTEEEEDVKPTLKKHQTSISSTSSKVSTSSSDKPTPLKKHKSEPPKESPVREFHKLMSKVTFVMSGFQNPYRGELRDRAVAMGAKYKPDWGKGCTHLICAFVSTPKYNQVEGKGRIVSKKWIDDSFKQKKLLPWRSYRVGDAETPDEDSEDDYVPAVKKSLTPKKKADSGSKVEKKKPVKLAESDDEDYGGDTDSGEDTEDEIRKIKAKQDSSPVKKPAAAAAPVDVKAELYDVDTDEDEVAGPSKMEVDSDSDADSGLPELPDFFLDKLFFFYGAMAESDRRLLTRYVTAYGGEIENYMTEKVNYVVSSAKWDSNFEDALSDNPNLIFVKPKWIYVCHDKQKCVPHQPYIVVPAE